MTTNENYDNVSPVTKYQVAEGDKPFDGVRVGGLDSALCVHEDVHKAILDTLENVNGTKYKRVMSKDEIIDGHKTLIFAPVPDLDTFVAAEAITGVTSIEDDKVMSAVYFKDTHVKPLTVVYDYKVFSNENLLQSILNLDIVQEQIGLGNSLINIFNSSNMINIDDHSMSFVDKDTYDGEEIIEPYAFVSKLGEPIHATFDMNWIKYHDMPIECEKYRDGYELVIQPFTFIIQLYKVTDETEIPTFVIDHNFAQCACEVTETKHYPWTLTPEAIYEEEKRVSRLTDYTTLIHLLNNYKTQISELDATKTQVESMVQYMDIMRGSVDMSALENSEELTELFSTFSSADKELEESRAFLNSYAQNRAILLNLMHYVNNRITNLFGDQINSAKFQQEQLIKGLTTSLETATATEESAENNKKAIKKLNRRLDGIENRFDITYLKDKIESNSSKLRKEITRLLKKCKTVDAMIETLEITTHSFSNVMSFEQIDKVVNFMMDDYDTEVGKVNEQLKSWLLTWYLVSRSASAIESGNDAYYKMHLYNALDMSNESFDIDVDINKYKEDINILKKLLFALYM